ncbi:hypothetical protein AB7W12_22765 [Providencia rettgeri]
MEKIKTSAGLIFDPKDSKCNCKIEMSQGELFAFIVCYQYHGGGSKTKEYKKYWGRYSHNNPEKSILEIMESGGKWPDLQN